MKYLLTILVILSIIGCSKPETVPIAAPAPLQVEASQQKSMMPKPATRTDNKKISNDILDQLYNAAIAFSIPELANINDNIHAELLVDITKDGQELEKQLKIEGQRFHDTVKASRIIRANLFAPDFKITNMTPDEQALSSIEPTQWQWILEPTQEGKFEVDLTITALVKIDDTATLHTLKTYNKPLVVEVTRKQKLKIWFDKYWQWFFSTLLLPLGMLIYKSKFSKKEE